MNDLFSSMPPASASRGAIDAEAVLSRLGIPVVPLAPSRMKGAAASLWLSVDRRTRELLDAAVRIDKKANATKEERQWDLWHEVGHFFDFTEVGGGRFRRKSSPRFLDYGRVSLAHALVLRSASEFLSGLTPVTVSIQFDGASYFTVEDLSKAHCDDRKKESLQRALRRHQFRAHQYKTSTCELFAEAFACHAMRPDQLKANAPQVASVIGALFEEFGIVQRAGLPRQ